MTGGGSTSQQSRSSSRKNVNGLAFSTRGRLDSPSYSSTTSPSRKSNRGRDSRSRLVWCPAALRRLTSGLEYGWNPHVGFLTYGTAMWSPTPSCSGNQSTPPPSLRQLFPLGRTGRQIFQSSHVHLLPPSIHALTANRWKQSAAHSTGTRHTPGPVQPRRSGPSLRHLQPR